MNYRPSSLGAEAAHHFLQIIGVDYDSSTMMETSDGGSDCRRARAGEREHSPYDYHRTGIRGECDVDRRERDQFGEGRILLRPQELFPTTTRERGVRASSSSTQQDDDWGCGDTREQNLLMLAHEAGTVPSAEPWSTARDDQLLVAGSQTPHDDSRGRRAQRQDVRTARKTCRPLDTTARSQRGRPSAPESPQLPSKSKWIIHGGEELFSNCRRHEDANEDANEVDDDG